MDEFIERKKLEEAFDNADPDVCESDLAGRKAWVQSHGIDMDGKTTVADFIRLCEDDFGGDAIRALKERMETHD